MESYKIIEYTNDYRESLRLYLHKIYPDYTDAYIDYCVHYSVKNHSEEQSSLLVVNGRGEIVGCHLYYNTKAKVCGIEMNVRWGHDTYLDVIFRHKTHFPLVISKIDAFGIGLSEVNKKIQKHYNILFFDNLNNYLWVNKCLIGGLFRTIIKKESKGFKALERIVFKDYYFRKANNVEDLIIPEDGYWCNDNVDVDFIRDRDFFEYRFFNNKVHSYFVYHLDNGKDYDVCYFVVRPIRFRQMETLFIVDFRYDLSCPQQLKAILNAANTLAKHNKIGVVLFTSNDTTVNMFYNRLNWKKSPIDLYAKGRYKTLEGASLFVTAADSDVDFLR